MKNINRRQFLSYVGAAGGSSALLKTSLAMGLIHEDDYKGPVEIKPAAFKNRQKVLILGSGTSTGIPIIGCKCSTCLSEHSENKRFRTSILITLTNGKKLLVDTTPDLRTQFLNNKVTQLDGVIITHTHADHLHGIDDIRHFYNNDFRFLNQFSHSS